MSGTVLRIDREQNGIAKLRFCEGPGQCAFTAVIGPEDMKRVGDLGKLEGKTIEVHGMLQTLDGGTQIVVQQSRQLRTQLTEETSLPSLLKDYDVDEKGHYSSGKFSHPKAARKTAVKKKHQLCQWIYQPSLKWANCQDLARTHTKPRLSSSRGYFVPLHTTPCCARVTNVERNKV